MTLPIGLPPLFTSEEDSEVGVRNVRFADEDELEEDNVEEAECDEEEVLDLEGEGVRKVRFEDEDEPEEDNVEEAECDEEEVLDLEGEVILEDVSGRVMESVVISSLFLHSC